MILSNAQDALSGDTQSPTPKYISPSTPAPTTAETKDATFLTPAEDDGVLVGPTGVAVGAPVLPPFVGVVVAVELLSVVEFSAAQI